MNLTELVWKSDTSELKAASDMLGQVATNMARLGKAGKDQANVELTLAKAAEKNAKANLDNAKAQDTRLKSTIAADKADKSAAQTTEKKTKSVDDHTKAVKSNVDMLQRQTDIYDFMTSGFSKGQASILATAKATGQLTEELKRVLEAQKQFSSDPFDRSDTGLKRLQRTLKESADAQAVFNQGHNLTSKQAKELSNDLDRLGVSLKHQGKSYQDITKAQALYKQEFLETASTVNRSNDALATMTKQRKEVVSATNYVVDADRKMAAALNISNASLDKGSTDSLVKYEVALKRSGIAQAEVTRKLDSYKAQLAQVQAQEMKYREAHLARALAPQATDIAVSLYSGQAPLTVLLQQSGQMVDLLRLSGVEADNFGKAMRSAIAGMVPSILAVGKGLVSVVAGGFYDAGKAALTFAGNITGMNKVMSHANDIMYLWGGNAVKLAKFIGYVGVALNVLASTGILLLIAGLGAAAVGLKEVIEENNSLAKSFALSGASIGATHAEVIGYVKALSDAGATTGQATDALNAMAKEGKFTSSEIMLVGKSAIEMSKGFGIAIEDTVKQFAKLKEKPTEALLEIAKSTGMVTPEIVKMVIELEKSGKKADAAALAMDAYAKTTVQAIGQMKENYNGFSLFIINLGSSIKKFFSDTFKTLFLATDPAVEMQNKLGMLRDQLSKRQGIASAAETGAIKTQIKAIEDQIAKTSGLAKEQAEQQKLNAQNASRLEFFHEAEMKLLSDVDKKERELNKIRQEFASKGKLTDAEKVIATKAIAHAEKELLDARKKANKVDKDPTESYYQSLMRSATNAGIAVEAANADMTKSQIKLLEALSDPRWNALSERQKQNYLETVKASIATEQQEQAVKKLGEAEDFRLAILGKSDKIGKQYYEQMKALEEHAKVAGWSREQIEELTVALFKSTPAWQAVQKAIEKSEEELRKFGENSIAAQAAVNKENSELDLRAAMLGKNSEEQRKLQIEYQKNIKLAQVDISLQKQLRDIERSKKTREEKAGLLSGSDLEEYQNAIVQAEQDAADQRKLINREVAVQYSEELQKELDRISGGLTDSLATAMFEGGKAGSAKLKDFLKNEFKNYIIKVFIQPMMGNLVGSLMGGAGGATGAGGGGILGTLMQGTQMYSGLTSGTGILGSIGSAMGLGSAASAYSLGASSLSLGAGATSGIGLSAGGGGLGVSVGGQVLGSGAAGAGSSGTLMSALGSIPGWGWALAAAVALAAIFGKKATPHAGGASSFSAAGGLSTGLSQYTSANTGFADTRTYKDEMGTLTSELAKSVVGILDTTATTFGKTAGYTAATAFADDTSKDGAWGSLLISNLGKSIVDWRDTQTSTWAPKEFADGEAGMKEYLAAIAVSARDALKDAIGDVEWAKGMLDALGASPTLEGLTQTVQQINTYRQALDQLGKNLVGFSGYTDAAVSALVKLSGGMEGLIGAASSYYENFYTQAEKTANVTRDVSEALAKVGLEMPKTREGFRALVEEQMRLGETGVEAVRVLLGVSGAFAEITEASEELSNAKVKAETDERRAFVKARREAQEAEQKVIQDQIEASKKAAEEASKAAFDMFERIKGYITSINDWLKDTLLDASSLLSPEQKVQEAQSQFNEMYARALTGDEQALKEITSTAGSLRTIARDSYASSSAYAAIEQDIRAKLSALNAGMFAPTQGVQSGYQGDWGGVRPADFNGVLNGVSLNLADVISMTGLGFESASLLTSNKRYDQALLDSLSGKSQSEVTQALLTANRSMAFGAGSPEFYGRQAEGHEYLALNLGGAGFAQASGGANASDVYRMGLQFGLTDAEIRQALSIVGKGAQADTSFWQSNWASQAPAIGNWALNQQGGGQDVLDFLAQQNAQKFQTDKEAVEAIRGSGEANAHGIVEQTTVLQSIDNRLANLEASNRMGAIT